MDEKPQNPQVGATDNSLLIVGILVGLALGIGLGFALGNIILGIAVAIVLAGLAALAIGIPRRKSA